VKCSASAAANQGKERQRIALFELGVERGVAPVDQDDAEFLFGQADIGNNRTASGSLRVIALIDLEATDPECGEQFNCYFHGSGSARGRGVPDYEKIPGVAMGSHTGHRERTWRRRA
jgi:hypothetical protein